MMVAMMEPTATAPPLRPMTDSHVAEYSVIKSHPAAQRRLAEADVRVHAGPSSHRGSAGGHIAPAT
jgi:hypothetical protein